eukprot:CAMPEP_0170806226 /NCGR_PEP_ID=MMETSP0733-20121128/31909_1 /TAXON_ID=186038 /ORGANISM="Fragilariopsis kerguelensis, Strain L26-C5" /LENGTH=63 /DNA_ID=CAMNT_0011160897 /DNA_START=637 /DNA_END=828 /DNA_ORIENTATION=+
MNHQDVKYADSLTVAFGKYSMGEQLSCPLLGLVLVQVLHVFWAEQLVLTYGQNPLSDSEEHAK